MMRFTSLLLRSALTRIVCNRLRPGSLESVAYPSVMRVSIGEETGLFRTFGAVQGCRAAAIHWRACVFGPHEPVSARTGASSAGGPGIPAILNGIAAARLGSPRSEERRVGKECRSRWSPYH